MCDFLIPSLVLASHSLNLHVRCFKSCCRAEGQDKWIYCCFGGKYYVRLAVSVSYPMLVKICVFLGLHVV